MKLDKKRYFIAREDMLVVGLSGEFVSRFRAVKSVKSVRPTIIILK